MLYPFSASAALVQALRTQDNSTKDLDKIVVIAAGFEQKITDAPASISVIDQSQLQRKRYSNLAQVLADLEGVDVN